MSLLSDDFCEELAFPYLIPEGISEQLTVGNLSQNFSETLKSFIERMMRNISYLH